MTNRCACGDAMRDWLRRETTVDCGSTARMTRLATGSAAALDSPQWFWPSHGRLPGRGGEDHAPGSRLEDRGDDHPDGLVHVAPAVLDYDHRAVVEVGHALVLLLPFLDHLDVHLLPRDDNRFEGVRQVVQVKDPDAFEVRPPVGVVGVPHDRRVALRRQLDQLHVDLGHLGHVLVDEPDVDERFLLEHVEYLETAPSTIWAQAL